MWGQAGYSLTLPAVRQTYSMGKKLDKANFVDRRSAHASIHRGRQRPHENRAGGRTGQEREGCAPEEPLPATHRTGSSAHHPGHGHVGAVGGLRIRPLPDSYRHSPSRPARRHALRRHARPHGRRGHRVRGGRPHALRRRHRHLPQGRCRLPRPRAPCPARPLLQAPARMVRRPQLERGQAGGLRRHPRHAPNHRACSDGNREGRAFAAHPPRHPLRRRLAHGACVPGLHDRARRRIDGIHDARLQDACRALRRSQRRAFVRDRPRSSK